MKDVEQVSRLSKFLEDLHSPARGEVILVRQFTYLRQWLLCSTAATLVLLICEILTLCGMWPPLRLPPCVAEPAMIEDMTPSVTLTAEKSEKRSRPLLVTSSSMQNTEL